jgi:hypothetical protein
MFDYTPCFRWKMIARVTTKQSKYTVLTISTNQSHIAGSSLAAQKWQRQILVAGQWRSAPINIRDANGLPPRVVTGAKNRGTPAAVQRRDFRD